METKPYVLVVDDDQDARTLLSVVMESLGVEVVQAEDGAQALTIINQRKPTVVFLDLMMPVMNGFEVLFRLRSTPDTRSIPVIVVSAVSQNEMLSLPGVSKVIHKTQMRVAEVQNLVSSLLPGKQDSGIAGAAAR